MLADVIAQLRLASKSTSPQAFVCNAEAAGAIADALEAAQADSRRLDWLIDAVLFIENGRVGVHEFVSHIAYGESIRAAIDAAMKENQP